MTTASLTIAACLLASLPSCGGSVYQQSRFTGGQDRSEAWARLSEAPDLSLTKPVILDALGPPAEVLPLAGGDIFVYRLRRVSTDVFQISSGMFGAGNVLLYANVSGRSTDQVVFVRFDRLGSVVDMSSTAGQRR